MSTSLALSAPAWLSTTGPDRAHAAEARAHAGTAHGGKVPAVTAMFWVIKIAATTLGETGGDAVSMTLKLGYAVSTGIFLALFVVLVLAQCAARKLHPALYWAVIVATTTAGTTMADYADRSLGYGYQGGSLVLAAMLLVSIASWYITTGSVSVARIDTLRTEAFYWVTILFSNTLGTALGDFAADNNLGGAGLGYEGGAALFAVLLLAVFAIYRLTRRPGVAGAPLLFWSAFILTRPLGATLGDLLTKPVPSGGLALSRVTSSLIIAGFMAACILIANDAGRWRGVRRARAPR